MTAPRRVRAGLIGSGIQASGSPALHMEEGRAHGLDYSYKLFDLDQSQDVEHALPRLLDIAEETHFAGVNITHPCKQAVIPLLHKLSEDAETLGAVNTVLFRDGVREGHNTDWFGFSESLRRGLPDAALDHVTVIGAGGAGVAVAYALLRSGAKRVGVHDVRRGAADALVERLGRRFEGPCLHVVADLAETGSFTNGFVNCTPVGMEKYPGIPLPLALLEERRWVADIVYFPIETALLKAARASGCATLDGGGMAVFQAAEAFRLFTGRTPDYERMVRRFRETVSLSLA